MPEIHPSAVIDEMVAIADDVVVGPGCVLTGDVTVGPGTRLVGNVYLNGPVTMGGDNVVYPFACLGFAPQSTGYDPNDPGCGLIIGDGNTFREGVTIHRAMTDEGPTRVGNGNYFMANAHAGHDAQIGSDCIFGNQTLLAGHVRIDDRVITGGNAVVHQFCRVGRGAMFSGLVGVSLDVPPWFMVTGINICGSVNLIGLRRSGMPRESIDAVRWAYRTLYRSGHTTAQALDVLKERADEPIVAEYVEFIETSKRNICPARGKASRGTS
jgi:UDP-N-acetylglucosamine acyltransferase